MADPQRDYPRIALAYAEGAVADTEGERHCKWVRLACQRHLDDLARSEAEPDWPYEFDDWHASDICDFVEKLPHVEGRWATPTIVLEPWQVFVLVVVFGWRRRSDGGRRFSMAYIEVARKNGKSALTAGVALYALTCEGEPGPQAYIGATTGEQAGKVFKPAAEMVRRTPALREAFGLEAFSWSIACPDGGFMKPINSRSSTQDGHNPSFAALDELHAHKDRGLFDVVRSSEGSRKNPMLWMITTAGYSTVTVCYDQRTLVTKVLQGILDAEHYFGIIYTLDADDDPYEESNWIKANPNLGASIRIEALRNYAIEAATSAQSEGEFLTKRCDQWLRAANTWLPMKAYDDCEDPQISIDDFRGEPCWIGCDLADKSDIAAVCAVFERDDLLYAFPAFYLPEELVASLAASVGSHYAAWAKDGILTLTPGDWIDHERIEQDIRAFRDHYEVRAIRFDQYGGAQTMAQRLEGDGFKAAILAKTAKNFTDPARDLEARIKVHRFRHDGNPCLRWNASNAVAEERRDGSLLPTKEKKGSANKIDGIDALLLGLAAKMAEEAEPEAPEPVVWWGPPIRSPRFGGNTYGLDDDD